MNSSTRRTESVRTYRESVDLLFSLSVLDSRAHTVTLDKVLHSSPGLTLNNAVTVWSRCSCGWWGDAFSTCESVSAFHSLDVDECETASIEQGSEHLGML